jgi:hypothetical protein
MPSALSAVDTAAADVEGAGMLRGVPILRLPRSFCSSAASAAVRSASALLRIWMAFDTTCSSRQGVGSFSDGQSRRYGAVCAMNIRACDNTSGDGQQRSRGHNTQQHTGDAATSTV